MDAEAKECPDIPTIGMIGMGMELQIGWKVRGYNWRESDTDGDGLSDGWEIENGLDPLDTGEAYISRDGFLKLNVTLYRLTV